MMAADVFTIGIDMSSAPSIDYERYRQVCNIRRTLVGN